MSEFSRGLTVAIVEAAEVEVAELNLIGGSYGFQNQPYSS